MQQPTDRSWHELPADEVGRLLGTDLEAGLDQAEVKARRARFGPNQLTPRKGKSPLVQFIMQFRNPLMFILVIASGVTLILKDLVDAIVILGVVLFNAIIGFFQERRAEQAIAALSKTMSTEAIVVRESRVSRQPAAELVPGDIVQLSAGARVPADMRLAVSMDLQVAEAILTGESLPVGKDAGQTLASETVLADRLNMVYTSTMVTYGSGLGIVTATGDRTEVGRISQLISEAPRTETPLTKKIAGFSRMILIVILFLSAVIIGVGLLRGHDLVETMFAAIAMAVSAIPEGLPTTVTVTLAIGVSRMAKRKAIIRNLPAVETLGSTTVICSDKTGTLTQNQMTVTELRSIHGTYKVGGTGYAPEGGISGDWRSDQAILEMLKAGLWCNDSVLIENGGRWSVTGDPTEGALVAVARKAGLDPASAAPRLDAIPFDSQHQYMATLHEGGVIYVKGAAEVLLDKCGEGMDYSGAAVGCSQTQLHHAMEDMAGRGLRVLAFARLDKPGANKISSGDIKGLTLLGLQGMIDPPRPEAIKAVSACQQAGIAVKMITGDHALTAAVVGQQIGLCDSSCGTVLTGAELAGFSDQELSERAQAINVFARVAPEQKLRLVRALQARGHVVAMTGDGVNDAPALTQADIGVAMGITGTDVAKEAADMVLTDDNFATIEAAVEEGRGVFDNLVKFIVWTIPTNLGEALVLLAALIMGTTLPVLPIQLLWINMVTAAVLGTTLAFEPKEADIMNRRPRAPTAPILTGPTIVRIFLVGFMILAGAFGLFEYEMLRGASVQEARTVAVNVIVFVELFYLFNARSLSRSTFQIGFFSNPWAIGGAVLMVLVQLPFTYLPFMQKVFGTAPIGVGLWLDVLAVSLAAFVVIEIEKRLRKRAWAGG